MMPLPGRFDHPFREIEVNRRSTVYRLLIHEEGETMGKHDDQVSF
jgi:hypothetical protein